MQDVGSIRRPLCIAITIIPGKLQFPYLACYYACALTAIHCICNYSRLHGMLEELATGTRAQSIPIQELIDPGLAYIRFTAVTL